MAVQIIEDGPRNIVVKIDDTGTGAGTAVDVSALVPSCTLVNIDRIWFRDRKSTRLNSSH